MRAARQQTAQAEARANARLALIIAIGELQKQMVPDQRVSANGAILAESTVRHPHWAGVWNSWRAGTMLAGTTSPDAASEHRTIMGTANSGMSPTYVAQRKDHFRSWLVSLDQGQAGGDGETIPIVVTAARKKFLPDSRAGGRMSRFQPAHHLSSTPNHAANPQISATKLPCPAI